MSGARGAGVGRSRMRASDLTAPFHGMRVRGSTEGVVARAAALLTVLPPGSAFSHWTAAQLWHLPIPSRREDTLHVTIAPGGHRIRRPGVTCHRASRPVTQHLTGLPVVAPGATWCDLAPLMEVPDLVSCGDALVARSGTTDTLTAALRDHAGRRGLGRARAALALVRIGSRSPQETRARLLFHQWGLPEPELNVDVIDESGWLANVDFLWRCRRVIGEYYGGVHAASWRQDLGRAAVLEDAGYRMVVMTSRDLGPGREQLRARLEGLLLPPCCGVAAACQMHGGPG